MDATEGGAARGAAAGPSPGTTGGEAPARGSFDRWVEPLRRHPVLCLFLLTPGLVEYTSGSSSFTLLFLQPALFLLFLGINAAMYTSGALLIREALVRWQKGWPTLLALGGAYAIMEEGIADQTTFNPSSSPIGAAGTYGHVLGTNWLWVPDVFVIHILMSLGLPLLLLEYALPETRGRSLLSDRAIAALVALLVADTGFLAAIVATGHRYWYGQGVLAASVTIILLLIVLGYRLPRHLLRSRPGGPSASRGAFFLVGLFVYPLMVLLALLGAGAHVPPAVVLAAIVLEIVLLALWFLRHLGSERNERHLLAFGLGLLMLGMSLGLWTEFPLELVAVADAAVLYLFYRLDQRFARAASASTASATPAPPPPGPPVTPTRT